MTKDSALETGAFIAGWLFGASLFLGALMVASAQTIPSQFAGLSTSTDSLSPMVLPARPLPGASYIDTYHPDGPGFVNITRLPYRTGCSIRAWQSSLFVGAFLPLSYGGKYYSVPYSAGVFVPQAFSKATNASSAAGTNVLYFASTNHTNYFNGIVPGVAFTVTGGANIPANTTIVSYTSTSVTLSANLTGSGIASGASITFSTLPTQQPYQEISYDEACNQVKLYPSYSTRQVFNSDGSRFMVLSGAGTGAAEFYRTSPLAHEKTIINTALTSTNGSETWSHTDPDVMYFYNSIGGPKFQSLNVSTGTVTTVHDFTSDCSAGFQVVQNGGAGNPSMDDRYWAGFCKSGSGQSYEKILVYDKALNAVVSQRTVASICGGLAPIDTLTMSPSGLYVVVAWAQTGREDTWHTCQGNELFDRTTLQSLGMVTAIDAHNDVGLDVNGNDVLVAGPYGNYTTNEPLSNGYTIYVTKLSEVRPPPYTLATSYVRRYLIPCSHFYAQSGSDPYTGCSTAKGYPPSYHISGRGSESASSRGWFLMSTYGMPANPPGEMPGWGKSENIAFRIDTNILATRAMNVKADFRRVSRTVAHRNNDNTQRGLASGTYWQEPHGTVNRDFTKVLFASSWFADQGQVLTYVVDLPTQAQQVETIGVSVFRRGGGAIVTFGRRALPLTQSCTVRALSGATTVGTHVAATGLATRQVAFDGLPSIDLTFTATCGVETGQTTGLASTALSGTGSLPIQASGAFTVTGAFGAISPSGGVATISDLPLGVPVAYQICRSGHCGAVRYAIP